MPLRRAIDDPYLGAGAPEIVTHLFESRAVEKARDRDEAHDPFLVLVRKTPCRVMTGAEDLPSGPAPKINI